MEHVTIVGAEDDVLVLATESGERFALPIDEVLRTELRRAKAGREEKAPALAASPREIQSHIRAGMSAADVAELLGVSREVVERFESPVLAEREHIVGQALAVPVLIGSEVEPDAQPTFGVAIRAKLADLGADGERWAAWKEESGWVIKLEFTANDVDHDARWSFDPRRSALAPHNADATQLSRQGSLPEGLIPRLRALDKDRSSPYKDETRFDSGAFGPRLVAAPAEHEPEDEPEAARPAVLVPRTGGRDQSGRLHVVHPVGHRGPAGGTAPPPRAAGGASERRRRVRGVAPPGALRGARAGLRARSAPAQDTARPGPSAEQDGGSRRRRREMPSWDEIVFGARSERLSRPAQRANAPNRSSGTRSSSGLSDPCCPIMPCARGSSAAPSYSAHSPRAATSRSPIPARCELRHVRAEQPASHRLVPG